MISQIWEWQLWELQVTQCQWSSYKEEWLTLNRGLCFQFPELWVLFACPLRPGLSPPSLRPWACRPSPDESDSNPKELCHSALSQDKGWELSPTFAKQLRDLYAAVGINHGWRKWMSNLLLDFKYHFWKWMSLSAFPIQLVFLWTLPSIFHCSQLFNMFLYENLVITKNIIDLTHALTQHFAKCMCLHSE